MAFIFNESYYLMAKTAQQNAIKHDGRSDWTIAEVTAAIKSIGMTPIQHYLACGRAEGLNPNSFFNEDYYLRVKTAQQNAIAHDGRTDWTVAEVRAAIASIGMIPAEHYEAFGRGEGLNPNNSFNESFYLAAKAAQQNSIKHDGRTNWTAADVAAAIASIGMIPAQHYDKFGCFETDASGNYINPASGTNTKNLWQAEVDRLKEAVPGVEWTLENVIAGYKEAGVSVYNSEFIPTYPDPGGRTLIITDTRTGLIEGTSDKDVITVTKTGRVEKDANGKGGISGGNGDDVITVVGYVDGDVSGGNGKDILVVNGTLTGTLHGNAGNDVITIGEGARVSVVRGDEGNDTITVNGNVTGYVYGDDGDDTIVIGSSGKVDNEVNGGAGNDTITVNGDVAVYGGVRGGTGNDTIVIGGNGKANYVNGEEGDDIITIRGTVNNGVSGGDGNDTITIEAGAKVGLIDGGKGVDKIILKEAGMKVQQSLGDSGQFSATLINDAGVVATTAFDILDSSGVASKINVFAGGEGYANFAGGFTKVATAAEIGAVDNAAYWLVGTYADGTFTANANGTDTLLVYDCGTGTAVTMEAMVLLGVSNLVMDGDAISVNPA